MAVQSSSSLNLRALLKTAADRSQMDSRAAAITGLGAPAKALFVAARAARDAVVLAVVPTDADVEQMTSDVRFFLGALEGLPGEVAERSVLAFPSLEVDPYRGLAPHLRVASTRARALHAASTGTARVVVASAAALLPRLSRPERLLKASLEIKPGTEVDPQVLAELFVDAGFTREDPVDAHGEFCVRGGVVDFFPANDVQPVRLEFIGDTVESIRRYDAASQRSVGSLDQITIVPTRELFEEPGMAEAAVLDRSASLFDYLASHRQPVILVSENEEVRARATQLIEQIEGSYSSALALRKEPRSGTPPRNGAPPPEPSALLHDWRDLDAMLSLGTTLDQLAIDDGEGASEAAPDADPEAASGPRAVAPPGARGPTRSLHIPSQPAVTYHGRLPDWVADLRRAKDRGETILFVAASAGRAERTAELLKDYEVVAVPIERSAEAHTLLITVGRLSRGFRLPQAALQLFVETDVFEEEARAPERRRSLARTFLSDFRDLKVGDLVVHVDHGIGVFVGLKRIRVGAGDDTEQEFMELRYAADDKLFVPVKRLDLVQKYTGGARPPLDRLGGTTWERAKTRVKKAMRDMAEELLKLYAARRAMPGHGYPPDTHWQQEFEDAFAYELTPDQQAAITDIKADMEAPTPMDRLLCGDVGYGKTEVAMRAAFKAVMDGKQVAFLAPTTVLAFQHLRTLTERFAAFPVRIDMVSRFRSKAEQKQALADLAAGKLDIIVGTHRLLSKDVSFRDLGLLVVDEEQRFGVAHKERIKQMRKRVDVLTMTATPIPRTLNMSLVGIRDMSIIETPPKDRLSIQTNVVKFDQQVITRAVRNELARGGQVYFVHNRVESIFSIANLLARLVPEAKLVIGHGQMSEDVLERAMVDFVQRKFDILIATTIIENGLDIPNVNTIIVNRSDRYGLAQLYQLRGRVGRSDRPAYAYLLIPPEEALSPVARKRLAAIREFSDLGSGFRVAALDLEIRGAGNLLGGEQSGHIDAVGFEMYMKLLEQAVRELKGEGVEEELRATVNLGVDLRIEDDYVPDMNQRLMLYRRVASSRSEQEIDRVLEEVRDRYGPWPDSVLNLAEYGRIRVLADRLGVETLDRQGPLVVLTFRPAPTRPGDGGTPAKTETAAGQAGSSELVERLMRMLSTRGDVSIAPPSGLKLDLKAPVRRTPPAAKGPNPPPRGVRPGSVAPFPGARLNRPTGQAPQALRGHGGVHRPWTQPGAGQGSSPGTAVGRSTGAGRGAAAGNQAVRNMSWWTARAQEGEVRPGFSKEEILKPIREDPRGEDGVFTRVLGLLRELAGMD